MAISLLSLGSHAAAKATSKVVNQGTTAFADVLKAARGANATAKNTVAPAPNAEAGKLAELQRHAQALLAGFKESIGQLLADRGVDTSHEIRFESDSNGKLKLVGDHPERDKIEEILSDNPDLSARFEELAAAFRQSQAVLSGSDEAGLAAKTFSLTLVGGEARPALS